EEHARRIERLRLDHLLERAHTRRRGDQRLHARVEVVAAAGEESGAPPVIRVPAAGRLVRGAGSEELRLAAVPAPAVEELGGLVPLLPRLRRLQIVLRSEEHTSELQ